MMREEVTVIIQRAIVAFFLLFCFATIIFIGLASASELELNKPILLNNLPTSLITIEESAFEGTALSSVRMTENVTKIEDNAFDVDKGLIIQAGSGTFAKFWAEKHGFHFVLESFFTQVTEKDCNAALLLDKGCKRDDLREAGSCFAEKQERRTGRPFEETKIARYQGLASEHIQSRFFP